MVQYVTAFKDDYIFDITQQSSNMTIHLIGKDIRSSDM